MTTSSATTTVSAPGKILLAGGYVVLEAPNVGVVLAVDKRFYSTVVQETISKNVEPEAKKLKTGEETCTITVHSPQFGATWKYQAITTTNDSNKSLSLVAEASYASTNDFVEKTLRITLAYLLLNKTAKTINSLDITILADNDFYSVAPHLQARNWEATPENLAKLPSFLPCKLSNGGSLQKTGLGSSAALVTSLVGALVVSTSIQNNTKTMDDSLRRRIHNLAQICHCHAQGKVGSGFDVSSASYGSHVYQRFPKALLSGLLQELETNGTNMPQELAQKLHTLVEDQWAGGVQKPLSWSTDLLQIMLADVSGGSESPSMARKILKWKDTSDDVSCWNNLLQYNQQVVDITDRIAASLQDTTVDIAELTSKLGECQLDESLMSNGTTKDVASSLLVELRTALLQTRKNLKTMGDLADVPVEPAEQTALADATMDLPGVVASLVPGAGGYDALVVVYVNTDKVRERICQLWTNYKALSVCPLAVQFGAYGDGVRYETETPQAFKPEE